MQIDFEKSHPAVNIEDKRRLYEGFFKASMIGSGLLMLLLAGMAYFLV